MEDSEIMNKWNEVKSLMESLEPDLVKNARGVAAAGVRARKGLRDLRSRISDLVKTTVALDKTRRVDRTKS